MSLDQYLKKFKIEDKTLPSTHTKIGNNDLSVYGGNYHIPDDKMNEFYTALIAGTAGITVVSANIKVALVLPSLIFIA